VLSDYFEAQWALAVPISGETSPAHRGGPRSAGRLPTRDERHLLARFATGLKDEAIAQQLGISSRTLRRRVTTLFTELGVSNRFSAGVAAARRGWV
jgi:DNA-binding NarL/FixJ family response regulator